MAASAGGLEAVSELLAALPAQAGAAYIVVQHLDPGHESSLTGILAKRTSLPVVQAYDGVAAEPDHVYVIAPNTTLSVSGDRIRVKNRASGLHHPADILFTSLAEERGDGAIGVVLSGGDGDGTQGIQAIKQAGGITFAQEPSSARFPSMPRSAIRTGCVDFVLQPHEIARELACLIQHPYLRPVLRTDVDTNTTTNAQKAADRWLLAHFAPASLLIDEGHNILHFRGEISPYLEHASGPPSVNLQRVVRPELLVDLSAAIQEARATGSQTRREGLRVGDRYQVAIDVIPLKRQSTERCYLILFEDGSRQPDAGRAQSDREIGQLNINLEKARESSQRKDEFLAMLAHELRNPLTPIRHAIHLLRHAPPDQSVFHLYDMIDRQTVRLIRLVDELLDVARITRGLFEMKCATLDLGVLVLQAAEAGRARIEERGHTLSLNVPDSGLLVDGDTVRLEQVISNLLENAAKYTDPGGQVTLTLACLNGEAILSVRDTGIGLEAVMLERIFDLFTQVDNSLVRSAGGLGLGLAVVRRVVELHGGHIEARSAGLGQGSEFIVRLPVLAAATKLQPAAIDGQPKAALATVRARRVLIIDDDADSAEALALLAQSWGHQVAIAHDGPGALALAESFAPESVLVDIGLPGMDGYELARRLREQPRYRDLVLVALTGYGREQDRSAAHAAGFDDHLVKPAEIEALEGILTRDRVKLDEY